ncbi:MAG: hypothetical protein HZA90_15770 [Verrucomicrobia bacterium]|nr:hypothetical protein [Verrucomicrobiota bacterium]
MKSLMILGATGGFLLAAGLGLAVETGWPSVFVNACVAAAVCGLAARWWSRVWMRGLVESLQQRAAAKRAATQAAPNKPTQPARA